MLFRSNDTATTEIYTSVNTLSLHDALPISGTVHTMRGPIRVAIENGELRWTSPAGVRATLVHNDGTRKAMPVSDKEQSWTIRL